MYYRTGAVFCGRRGSPAKVELSSPQLLFRLFPRFRACVDYRRSRHPNNFRISAHLHSDLRVSKSRTVVALYGRSRRQIAACQRAAYPLSCNPAVRKLLIRLGKSLFLGSGKATTRAKRRITSRVEGTGPSHRFPTRAFGSKQCRSLETAEA